MFQCYLQYVVFTKIVSDLIKIVEKAKKEAAEILHLAKEQCDKELADSRQKAQVELKKEVDAILKLALERATANKLELDREAAENRLKLDQEASEKRSKLDYEASEIRENLMSRAEAAASGVEVTK